MQHILITGASGFIGGRIAEFLSAQHEVKLKAGVRSYKGCARIGRLNVPLVRCDVTDQSSVDSAVRGATHVIHCAMSNEESIVGGTKHVMDACIRHGVEQVVYLSTGDVYSSTSGSVAEDSEKHESGEWYADSKRRAELICDSAEKQGLCITRIRPGIVYGPFCYAWTNRIGVRLLQGRVGVLSSQKNGVCNAVFIDDVVEACWTFLCREGARGKAFNINGPESIRWNDYFCAFGEALGVPTPATKTSGVTSLKSKLLHFPRIVAKGALAKYEKPILRLYQQNRWANALMRRFEGELKGTPDARELSVYARQIHYDDALLRRTFPDLHRTCLADGLRASADYLRVFDVKL